MSPVYSRTSHVICITPIRGITGYPAIWSLAGLHMGRMLIGQVLTYVTG